MLGSLLAFLTADMTAAVKKQVVAIAIYAASAVIFLFAFGFALSALAYWLASAYAITPAAADLIVAVGLLALSLIAALVGRSARRKRPDSSVSLARLAALAAAPSVAKAAAKGISPRAIGLVGILFGAAVLGRMAARD